MTEPMSSERRAEIREALGLQQTVLRLPRTTQWMARELLVEVDRLLVVEADLQELNLQLGDSEVWWTVGQHMDNGRIRWDHRMEEEVARDHFAIRDRDGKRIYMLGQRVVGQWQQLKENDD